MEPRGNLGFLETLPKHSLGTHLPRSGHAVAFPRPGLPVGHDASVVGLQGANKLLENHPFNKNSWGNSWMTGTPIPTMRDASIASKINYGSFWGDP